MNAKSSKISQVHKTKTVKAKQARKQALPRSIVPYKRIEPSPLQRYALALSSPFATGAVGAQVPDMYSFPTATYHAEGTIIVQSNAQGIASLALYPHPFLGSLDMTGGSISGSGSTQYAGTTTAWAPVTVANLLASLSNYRVVGAGWEVRNLMPPTTATGRVLVAPVPVCGLLPGPIDLAANALNNNGITLVSLGFGPANGTNGFTGNLIELPFAQEVTMQDLIAQELGFQARPLGPSAFDFRSSNSNVDIGSTLSQVSGDVTNAAGVVQYTSRDNVNSENNLGWNAFVMRFEGCPASVNIAEIKYIIHLEGTPSISTVSGSMVPGVVIESHVDPIGHTTTLTKVLNYPVIQLAAKAVGALGDATLGGGYSTLQNLVLSKLGMTF